MRILGRLNSVNVQKVVFCAEELGLAYERIDVGGKHGGNTTPEYLAKNPNGRIPVLEDENVILWESNAIVRYLAAKHGAGKLWPTDLVHRADADRWMDWSSVTLVPAMTAVFWQTIRTPTDKQDKDLIERSTVETQKAIDILDRALAGKRYITGDTFTMGDIPIACATHRWLHLPVPRKPSPNLQVWYERVMERPAAGKTLEVPIS